MACFIGRPNATDTSSIANNTAINYSSSTQSLVVVVSNDVPQPPRVTVRRVSAYYYGPATEPPPPVHLSQRFAGESTGSSSHPLQAEFPSTGFPVLLTAPTTSVGPDGSVQQDNFLVVRVRTVDQDPIKNGDVRTDPLSAVMNIA